MLLASREPSAKAAAGEAEGAGSFAGSRFQLDYLTQPNGLSDMLINWNQPNVVDRAKDTDEVHRMHARIHAHSLPLRFSSGAVSLYVALALAHPQWAGRYYTLDYLAIYLARLSCDKRCIHKPQYDMALPAISNQQSCVYCPCSCSSWHIPPST